MKARIKFQKYGAMKFIGHLDVMRYFQKAFRRAHYDNAYSQGFNPHQIMSFAAPLGVGVTSDAEYLDIELLSGDEPKVMVDRLNAVLTEGFRVTGFSYLKEQKENEKKVKAMALVSSADYLVSLKDGYTIGEGSDSMIKTPEEFEEAFLRFFNQPEIVVRKKTKTSENDVDIKPMITLVAFRKEEYRDKLKALLLPEEYPLDTAWLDRNSFVQNEQSVADNYQNGVRLFLQLDTGSAANLKPELVMEAFSQYLGISYSPFAWQVHRLEVYSRDEEIKRLLPLDVVDR